MANELIYYNAAKNALQRAAAIDEVKEIKDKAEALRLYALQQKDGELERHSAEIKIRAMRRIGELSNSRTIVRGLVVFKLLLLITMKAQALVARNLRKIRVAKGLSQESLAVDARIDRTYVSRLERGFLPQILIAHYHIHESQPAHYRNRYNLERLVLFHLILREKQK